MLSAKVDGVFREMHALKGEAMALGLGAFAATSTRSRTCSPACGSARFDRERIRAVVVKLGELMDYRTQLIELKEPGLPIPKVGATLPPPEDMGLPARETDVRSRAGDGATAQRTLYTFLNALTEAVAVDCQSAVQLITSGLELIPAGYAVRVRDICVQMIRNAIVHGIEDSVERKGPANRLPRPSMLSFASDDPEHYVLGVEDDGRGLNYEKIIDRALRSGMVRPEKAATMKPEAVFKLILEPGFTTAATVSIHAGRGVGLNMVSESVRACGGRLSIATQPGVYTRFVMHLPKQKDDAKRTPAG